MFFACERELGSECEMGEREREREREREDDCLCVWVSEREGDHS